MEQEKKKDYLKIGKRYKLSGGRLFFEFGNIPGCPGFDGWSCICFKDEEIYFNEPDSICYLSESNFFNSFDENLHRFVGHTIAPETAFSRTPKSGCWTHNDFLRASRDFVKCDPAYKHLDPEELAHRAFLLATWTISKEHNVFARAAALMAKEMGM